MKNSVDPDQLASSEASWSGSTLFKSYIYSYFKNFEKGAPYLGHIWYNFEASQPH